MATSATKLVLSVLFGLNLLCVIFLTGTQYQESGNVTLHTVNYEGIDGMKGTYYFKDPYIAADILDQLDVSQAVKIGDLKGVNYTSLANGFKFNDNYCKQHRAYMVENPEFIFEEKNFVINYWINHKLRNQVIPKLDGGHNLTPKVYPGALKGTLGKQYKYDFPLNANNFFMYQIFFKLRQVGKQYSCLSQESNHIPGHDNMARKDHLGQSLVDYAKSYESRPTCFNFNKYFPKTWLLQNKEQCKEFFKEFNSKNYQKLKKERTVVYFRKIGADVHEGKGVFPIIQSEEKKLRDMYKNGTLCGKIKYNYLMQTNVHNLLLVTQRKFGFRMYLLIASVNPVIAYYHDGYARLSLNEYDPKSKEKGTFVTNIGVNIDQNFRNYTEDQIQDFTCWFLDRFHTYLMEQGRVHDRNWLDNYLRPEFKRVMIHLVRMAQKGFLKISSVYELFGIDYVMDDNLDLWFIEANAAPLIHGFTKESTVLINQMLVDTFDIVHGLLRSRMKRVISYVNTLTKEIDPSDTRVRYLGDKRKEFNELIKNSFDPEFMPRKNNTYELIIDETKTGTARYAKLLPKNCL